MSILKNMSQGDADKTTSFEYIQDGLQPLSAFDIYKLFNNYRIWKYIIGILIKLNKTRVSEYKILEAGCGGGDKLRFLTELRAKPENCYGFDISERAIDLCKSLSPGTIHFQAGSVFDTPFGNTVFDIIICSGFLDCFNDDNDIKGVSRELNKCLRDDGILFVIDINENFNVLYGNNEEVMQKKLRSFDSTKGELEHLLSGEFHLFYKMHILGGDLYYWNGKWAQLIELPLIDNKIDRGEYPCAFSMWTFLKNRNA